MPGSRLLSSAREDAGVALGAGQQRLIEVYGDSQAEKGESTLGPQRVSWRSRHQPSMPTNTTAYPASMAAYTEAVNEFSKNAIAFIEQLPLLSKARDGV